MKKLNVKEVLKILSTQKFWVELFIMTFGMMVTGVAVYYFLVPGNLIVGSISGLSIVVCALSEKLFGTPVPLSTIVFVINAILLVMAYIFIGKEFGTKTVYTALILGPILKLYETYLPYQDFVRTDTAYATIMGDPWLDLLVFVILLSAAQAMLFKINASTGGLDIIGKIINKYLHMDIGVSVSIGGAIICCTAFSINPFYMVVLGLIGTWINGIVIDYFSAGLNKKKRVCIVSPEYKRIQEFIIKDLVRGCTLNEVTGGYTNEKKIEVQSLLTKDEFASLMNLINTEEINAFITADTITEVYGLWAKKRHGKVSVH